MQNTNLPVGKKKDFENEVKSFEKNCDRRLTIKVD
jgi:hypothetical protein